MLLARAYRALGDEDAATLELGAAHTAFEHLGAALDLRTVAEPRPRTRWPDGLTHREVEVLRSGDVLLGSPARRGNSVTLPLYFRHECEAVGVLDDVGYSMSLAVSEGAGARGSGTPPSGVRSQSSRSAYGMASASTSRSGNASRSP